MSASENQNNSAISVKDVKEWFTFAIAIVVADENGTLEPAVNKFEKRLGIKTELPADTTEIEIDVESY